MMNHKVTMHPEHDPSTQREMVLCEDHYALAESCNMLDADHGLTDSECGICIVADFQAF